MNEKKSIKNWWDRKQGVEKVGYVTSAIAMILQLVFAIIIPCLVLKIKYDVGYIFAGLVVLCISTCVLNVATQFFYLYLKKHFKTIVKKIVIIVSVILVMGCILPNNIAYLDECLYPTTNDYTVLFEKAEDIDSRDELFEKTDYFSWSKSSKCYYADFYEENIQIDVTYNENFEITEYESTDCIIVSIIIFVILLAVAEILAIAVSHLVFVLHKYISKK